MKQKTLLFKPLILASFLLNEQDSTYYRVYLTHKTYSDIKADTVSDAVLKMQGKSIHKIERLYCRTPDVLTKQKSSLLDRKKK